MKNFEELEINIYNKTISKLKKKLKKYNNVLYFFDKNEIPEFKDTFQIKDIENYYHTIIGIELYKGRLMWMAKNEIHFLLEAISNKKTIEIINHFNILEEK